MSEEGAARTERWSDGVEWVADTAEPIRRASHALETGEGVWLVDPVDYPDLDGLAADLGEVAGVVVCFDRHVRDAAAVADRQDVAVHLPRPLAGVAADLAAPVEVFDDELAGTGYLTRTLVDNRFWSEVALHRPADGTLLVPEAVGTAPYYVVAGEVLGVHPALRLRPPRRVLSGLAPERVLVGHGWGVHEAAGAALSRALATARRTAPRLYWKTLVGLLGRS